VKFKPDENLPLELAEDLRALGHDADTVVSEGLGGSDDRLIVEASRAQDRVLLTLDKGIANVVRFPLGDHGGVVLFRPDTAGRRAVLSFVRARLSDLLVMELRGRLTVVTPSRIRIR